MAEKKEKTYPSQLDKVKEITDQLEAGLEKYSTPMPSSSI